MKNFLMITALAIASLSIASAKSYEVTLNTAASAGQTELRPGHYLVKINGQYAQFLNLDNRHSIMVPVRIETSTKKFDATAVGTKNEKGVNQIESIELRDTNSKLSF